MNVSVLRQNHLTMKMSVSLMSSLWGMKKLYGIMKEKDAIYSEGRFSDEDGVRAAELEGELPNLEVGSESEGLNYFKT